MLAGESKDRSLHRDPMVSWDRAAWMGRLRLGRDRQAACGADRELKGGKKVSGVSQAGAGLGVGGMGPGAKQG